jgi:hypothetical protein
VGDGVQLGPLGTAATNRSTVPAPGDYDDEEIGGMIGRGNRSTRRKPAQCRFVHRKPTCCSDANPGRRGGKPATNLLSYGTANFYRLLYGSHFASHLANNTGFRTYDHEDMVQRFIC